MVLFVVCVSLCVRKWLTLGLLGDEKRGNTPRVRVCVVHNRTIEREVKLKIIKTISPLTQRSETVQVLLKNTKK